MSSEPLREEDGFEERLIEGLLSNKPFLKHFFGQYLSSLNYEELMMFFTEYINSYDGSLAVSYTHLTLPTKRIV